jgi:ankyrin repeat protein
LHYAAFYGHFDVVKLLLDHGANHHARDMNNSLPLELAIQGGGRNASAVKYLIEKYGFGPGFSAPSAALLEACKLLVHDSKDLNVSFSPPSNELAQCRGKYYRHT